MKSAKHIVIIGGGFCGTITAVNLIKGSKNPLKITLIHSGSPLVRGVAYNSYSQTHLLNVAAGNMSAFPDEKEHFLDWLIAHDEYSMFEKELLAKTFMPRNLYGEYLLSVWNETLASKGINIELDIIDDYVSDIELTNTASVKVILQKGSPLVADYVVLATGNSQPRNPSIANMDYYASPTYFRNPWSIDSVKNLKPKGDVLIIGNGLTMVDTVIGLMELGINDDKCHDDDRSVIKGFSQRDPFGQNKIYSLSTNGFGILPHRHVGVTYNGLVKELETHFELRKLAALVNKHIKRVRKLGISAESVIDSLRPYSHKIWQSFTLEEKKQFFSKYRYMWGVARHRLPIFIFDIVEKLRISGQLEVFQGKLLDITETEEGEQVPFSETEKGVQVTFHNRKTHNDETLIVQRVINCTGPETSIYKTLNPLIRKLAEKNYISSDPLELGINTDISTYSILSKDGKKSAHLFTLGTNLKGQLWETTAVPELREQCKELAGVLLKACEENTPSR